MIAKTEKRAARRIQPKPGSHIVYMEGFGEIKDLSLNGAFILDPEPLPVGTEIAFSFRFGTDDIPAQGIVRRSVQNLGMGIELTGTSNEARNRLRAHAPALI